MKLQSIEDGLVFRLSEHTPDVIRQILVERGWTEYDEEAEENEGEWNLWWRTQRFRKSEHSEVAHWQRLNHFPRTDAITRKDCLVRNLRRMRCVHGASVYDFHPLSYILPNEYTKFVSDYAKETQKSGKDVYWICKPTDLSRGRGIFVFKDLKDLNYDCPVIVQKYISSPLLISGYKFDLRIYVCVPSFHPLTIYIYQEGIVRFGTDKFDLGQLGNVFSHLTNTSINKYGPAYSADKERVGPGCKWTLTQLRHFFRQMDNVDETLLWQRITNIVVLTLATQAPTVPKSQSCFELFGFDILIDQNFKPWLLEVNFSPALSMDCQADFIAKHSMLNDLIDLLNFKGDAERGGKSYRECRSPSPTYSTPRRYERNSQRKSYVRNDSSSNSTSSNSYTYSKPRVSKQSPLLLGRYKSSPRDANTGSQQHVTPRCSTLSKNNQRLPSIVKTLVDEEGESCDSGISSMTSIPRNLSNSSMASSQSSVDNQNHAGNDDEHYLAEEESVCLTGRTDLLEDNEDSDFTTDGSWLLGSDKHTMATKLLKSSVIDRPSSRSSEKERTASRKPFRLQSRPNYSKTLPRIQTSATTPRFNRSSKSTLTSMDYNRGVDSQLKDSRLHPIAEATNTPQSTLAMSMQSIDESEDPGLNRHTRSLRKKKIINSAPISRTPVRDDAHQSSFNSTDNKQIRIQRFSRKKAISSYKSPYSIESTKATKMSPSNPWPRTRVGDFVLAFPWNEAMRKASGANFDMKTIIRELQKILKKLLIASKEETNGTRKRRTSAAITKSEAIELSFMLKFEDKDSNPLYFWGPQHPPLLSSVLS
ncbi:uncharacterized protein LOC120338301 isoform X2 [Styela clava]